MAEYFDLLYTYTKDMFKDKSEEYHIKAIANSFRNGSSIGGVLFHLFGQSFSFQNLWGNSSYAQKFDDPFRNIEDTQEVLKQLPIGNYGLCIKNHACNLIKVSDTCIYFWDPNGGLKKIQDSNLEKAFLDEFKKSSWLYETGEKNSFVLFKRTYNSEVLCPHIEELKPGIFVIHGREDLPEELRLQFDEVAPGLSVLRHAVSKKEIDDYLKRLRWP
ncbi:MAG: hypothetical protein K1060chlam1_01195 [Candidatus Anoxychlamydiales bacterium]|nr:hypothetical protein [Candidatus Anoxychlamydiales bacterium]